MRPVAALTVLLSVACLSATALAQGDPAGGVALPKAEGKAKRVVLLTWDGTPRWLVDKMLAEGVLPNLAAMIKDGAAAEYSTTNFPNTTTPPGHAALYTGCYGTVNGVTGYIQPKTPPDKFDVTESWSGFDARNLRAEPLWVTLARGGKPSLLIHAPFAMPFGPYGAWKRFGDDVSERVAAFTGYTDKPLARDAVYSDAAKLAPASTRSTSCCSTTRPTRSRGSTRPSSPPRRTSPRPPAYG
jgi:hypothetical protein